LDGDRNSGLAQPRALGLVLLFLAAGIATPVAGCSKNGGDREMRYSDEELDDADDDADDDDDDDREIERVTGQGAEDDDDDDDDVEDDDDD